MSARYDGTLKKLLDLRIADWLRWLGPVVGLPPTADIDPVALESNLSTIQPTIDKVFRLRPPLEGLLHLEPQSSWDGDFSSRMLLYNVLLGDRHNVPVHTVAILLRPEANPSNVTGEVVRRRADGSEYLRFEYVVVRLWEVPLETLMTAGLGTLPLALLTDAAAEQLPRIVDEFVSEVERSAGTRQEANDLLSTGYILMGLRYDKDVVHNLFKGARHMKESSTYQAILDEGIEKGIEKGIIQGRQQDVLLLLESRFGTVSPEVRARVLSTVDPERLQRALRSIAGLSTPEDLPL